MNRFFILIILITLFMTSCEQNKPDLGSFESYPTPGDVSLWPDYSPQATTFKIWSPSAENVRLHLYTSGMESEPVNTYNMDTGKNGLWAKKIDGDLNGTYYTFQVKIDGKWLEETPGIYAQAVGVNGQRAMVTDMGKTNPEGWEKDEGPTVNFPNEAIIYELHIRDLTIHPESGSSMPGKYLGMVEAGTTGPGGVATGLDHLKELGITHVHLLPTFDHYAIDESRLDSAQFNWGYDPQNYNVPEGSFSTDPFNAEVRIKEFKQMVKTFHENGIGVILDVVYNHTGRTENSNFNLEVPGYYYRHWEDGRYSNASGCGNETASERTMVRKYILESVLYWAREYHLDGFRFDLMGIHDITTMNELTAKLKEVNPNIFVYGEGWTAGDSPLPVDQRALKKNIRGMPLVSAFSDDFRDGLKGSVFEEQSTGFVNGGDSSETSVMFGIIGAIQHPQINYQQVNYSKAPWTNDPWQSISYVSCHDNQTLYDKLKASRKDASEATLVSMAKLANAVLLTSQGVPFLHAGAEMLRTKNGEHNSYNLPDIINQINWNWKVTHADMVDYYKNLIQLRKLHPAFRMTSAEDVRNHLEFKRVEKGLISYQIKNHANGDPWKNIYVIFNARSEAVNYEVEGSWHFGARADFFDLSGEETAKGHIEIPPISMVVLFQK
ncbi:MAG: type I pullulanase [Saprospiraceae bacterium]|nr:type I pullulanase [Saprospiraceae bacterium]